MGFFDQLQQRWGVKNYWQVIKILLVFACTGFSILYLKRWLVNWLEIETPALRWTFSIVVILPLYQVILLMYGWLFGQYTFFLNFEKKLLNRLKHIFSFGRK
jgi:hypothetical protein